MEYCPFGWVCESIYNNAWEQLANLIAPPYVDGSKNELYMMYGFMAAGTNGITIVSTPDGRFVVYNERSKFGQTGTFGPNLSVTTSKGIIFGIVDPSDYTGDAITGSASLGILSASAWTTPDLKIKGVDGNASFGVSLPGVTASLTNATPITSGQYNGFMLLVCRLVVGGCGR
jgi:hypothetical protein